MDPVVDLQAHFTPAHYRRTRGLYGVSTALAATVAVFYWVAENIPAAIGFAVAAVAFSLLFRAARVRRQAAVLDGVPRRKHDAARDFLGGDSE